MAAGLLASVRVEQVLPLPALTLKEVAARIGGEVHAPQAGADSLLIEGVSSFDTAGPADLTLADSARLLPSAEGSRAAAIIVPRDITACAKPAIRADNPRLAFARALELFFPRRRPQPGIHPTAVVGADVELGPEAYVGPHVTIGDSARLGRGVEVHALVSIGEGALIGDETIIYPHVSIYRRVNIGRRCIIHAGCVIGSDGFGFVRAAGPPGSDCAAVAACPESVERGGPHYKIPQVGTVIIEDDVEIGANCAIDRATTDATIVGRGSKLDNMVQVGHNVTIGAGCIICGQVGIAGSVRIGAGAILAGQAGIADHLEIGEGAVVCAQAGVMGDVPPNSMVSGYPARPHRQQLRAAAALLKLPSALAELRELRRRLEALEQRLEGK